MHTNCFLIGGGGHAKVVLDAMFLQRGGNVTVWDDDAARSGDRVLGMLIHAPVVDAELVGSGHIAIGSSLVRRKYAKKLEAMGLKLLTVMHPAAVCAKESYIGSGSFIAAAALLAPGSQVGACVIVNHGAVIDHDCSVGEFSHIAPHATLAGGAQIGKDCFIGSGATVLPRVRLADGVIVGAGAVVTADVLEEGVTVYGVPAK